MVKVLKLLIVLTVGLGGFQSTVYAHPVAFQGSLGIMGAHSPLVSHNQINYSFRHWLAAGVHHFRRVDRADASHATMVSANFLLHRWNGESYQANLYAILGAGQSELSGQARATGMGLLQFDIEDRHLYFLAKHQQLINGQQVDFMQSVVRAGVAPYQDPFDGLHTWLILEYRNNKFGFEPAMDDLSPFLRVFYRNILFEIGQSFRGITRFNYIMHF